MKSILTREDEEKASYFLFRLYSQGYFYMHFWLLNTQQIKIKKLLHVSY